jgi:hypothetical protein
MLVDAAKEVVLGNVIFKIERVEKTLLVIRLQPNHSKAPGSF